MHTAQTWFIALLFVTLFVLAIINNGPFTRWLAVVCGIGAGWFLAQALLLTL